MKVIVTLENEKLNNIDKNVFELKPFIDFLPLHISKYYYEKYLG